MCREGRPDETSYGVRIFAGRWSDAYLQRENRQRGYTLVKWRGTSAHRHVAEPTELSTEEATGYWLEVLRVAGTLLEHFRPVKLNFEILGNALPHLHTHIFLRYDGDVAPGEHFPVPHTWDPESVPEEQLQRDAAVLRERLTRP